MEGTFADWLIRKGVKFHPETIIIDADEVFKSPKIERTGQEFEKPIFEYSFWEGTWVDGGGVQPNLKIGFYVSPCNLLSERTGYDVWAILVIGVNMTTGKVITAPRIRMAFQDGIRVKYDEFMSMASGIETQDEEFFSNIFAEFHPADVATIEKSDMDALGWFANNLLAQALIRIHLKSPIEYVEGTRTKKWQKVGKKKKLVEKITSPYFMLKVKPEQTRTEYEDYERPSRDKSEKSKLPLTLVRGHFRHVENHPIEHFNGTRWIAAHTRGNLDNGEIKKGYTIVLE